ncbi:MULTISPECIES: cellulose biosynthesis cyclic di-GMP-binding regulatory protein BcsB [Sinorhizobium]|uniref:cellulose biosynthesis cyclic di-GMP-binding regulatory protein BcsB n=1 Tax=Sinorhizobium TaxID=28105 RepID=UPI000BE83D33|nr:MULTISPECIES: cellulose biosynthesis cyclic di-GMP-binding regulatory protein BcsB [Sinorhizobium]PDT53108.1 cellulose synthase BcsB subunit [Sinorhizobium sp. NG07B]POH29275.1 cellulose synthase BcsB subunit [Sinorhizobium americanum]
MKRVLALLMAFLAGSPAAAQPSPFDMSGERPAEQRAAPPVEEAPQRRDAAPSSGSPKAVSPRPAAAPFRRFVLPFPTLSLAGEADERAWSLYLTPAQAQAGRRLTFAYQNAIVVAPEASVLSVLVNGKLVGEGAVQAADGPHERSYDIPAGLLRTGENEIRFRAQHRHRTDCTIQSTYELWTEIASESAFITFEGEEPRALTAIEDIQAVGTNETGRTQFNIVAPALEQPSRVPVLMRLAQGVGLLGRMRSQSIVFSRIMPELGKPGELTIVAGTATELQPLLPSLPAEAATGTIAAFAETGHANAPVLVLSGPDWTAVAAAIETITAATEQPSNIRDVIKTERWRLPQTPLVFSGKRLRFSELGVATSEFSGRRFRTALQVAIPSDFYADAYGEATILLDAGYTEAVRPGSRIDVYVNGNIATTVALEASAGGILGHLPINVTLRHFRPGANLIELEAVLLTEADKTCAPGTPASSEPRFALFDTSEFAMPDFARIARRPDLAATSGSAYPYRGSADPVALYIDRADPDTLSAAGTFIAKLAVAGGRPMQIETIADPLVADGRQALFIGAMPQLPKMVLTQAGIDPVSQASWGSAKDVAQGRNTQTALDEWQTRLKGGGWRSAIIDFESWLKENFDISLNSLRLIPEAEAPFVPPKAATLLVAQSANPAENATWTVIAAPSPALLREGVAAIADTSRWSEVSGHIAVYDPVDDKVSATPARRFRLIETQPPSFWNYRLIAANWLSTNILFYAVLLVSLAVVLGLATAVLLGKLGRRT